MDFNFSKDQKMIQKSVRDFLNKECPTEKVRELEEDESCGYDKEMWKKMAELGWMGIAFPEEYEGTEGDIIDLMILMEEMGAKLLPSPFFSTIVLSSLPILEYGSSEQKKNFLPRIATGEDIWTLALTEQSASYDASGIDLVAKQDGNDYVLSGKKLFVPYANVADYILVVSRTGGEGEEGITLFIVDANSQGIKVEVIPTTANDRQCEVIFEDVRVPGSNVLGEVGKGWDIVKFILQEGTILKSAEMLGGAQAALDITNEYAKQRIQFKRPIGSFQAVQHKLADLFTDVEGLRYLVYEATWGASGGSPSELLISMAKTKANEVYQRTCIECIRTHGAIGFTREQDIGLYYLRTKASQFAMGDSDLHKERIATELERYQPPKL
ncbi:MAG: acyl-CoA dehydrogenase family protein [Halobacteriota archaeon]|nr:acyl-CoA dehydrogenase family protein [Halobacteriota archaeon]